MTTTMSNTGQVTIPKNVRVAAGLTPGMPLDVSARNGGVLIEPAKERHPITMEQIEAARRVPRDFPWASTDEFMAFMREDGD